jgi:hypothetical protein
VFPENFESSRRDRSQPKTLFGWSLIEGRRDVVVSRIQPWRRAKCILLAWSTIAASILASFVTPDPVQHMRADHRRADVAMTEELWIVRMS